MENERIEITTACGRNTADFLLFTDLTALRGVVDRFNCRARILGDTTELDILLTNFNSAPNQRLHMMGGTVSIGGRSSFNIDYLEIDQKRTGLGRSFVKAICQICREHGLDYVSASGITKLDHGHVFWPRVGFRPECGDRLLRDFVSVGGVVPAPASASWWYDVTHDAAQHAPLKQAFKSIGDTVYLDLRVT